MRKRIREIVNSCANGSQREFAEDINVQESTVSTWLNVEKLQANESLTIKSDALLRMHLTYNINLNWLVTGRGTMHAQDEELFYDPKEANSRSIRNISYLYSIADTGDRRIIDKILSEYDKNLHKLDKEYYRRGIVEVDFVKYLIEHLIYFIDSFKDINTETVKRPLCVFTLLFWMISPSFRKKVDENIDYMRKAEKDMGKDSFETLKNFPTHNEIKDRIYKHLLRAEIDMKERGSIYRCRLLLF